MGSPSRSQCRSSTRVTSEESAEIRRLRRENAELRRANEILKAASAFFAAELDRPQQRFVKFVDTHRTVFTVESICRVLTEHGWPIASSADESAARPTDLVQRRFTVTAPNRPDMANAAATAGGPGATSTPRT